MQHEIRDGNRILQFKGGMLGESSSWRSDSDRWVEFKLFRTDSGQYILSRVGVSRVFHHSTCSMIKEYGLIEVDSEKLRHDSIPCRECVPDFDLPLVFPEKLRYWAQVSEEPSAVLAALYKYDRSGARYLTNVAKRLLELVSDKDPRIASIYRVELIP